MIYLQDLLALRKEGLTYQKIADKYGVKKYDKEQILQNQKKPS
jgi:hypothetical protein